MQYQVFKEKTGELVAWIDTADDKGIAKKGYAIKCGEELTCQESEETLANEFEKVVAVAEFEKVSQDTYHKMCTQDAEVMLRIPDIGVVGTDHYLSEIKLPERSTYGSAGYDFFIPYDLTIRAGETVLIPTGIKVKMAEGYVLMMYPRSGLGFKYKMSLDNTVGVIDSDYYNNESTEGHISVKMTNHSDKDCFIKKGSAYCQGVFHKYYVTDNDHLTEKQKRIGGYGSTSK